MLAALLLLALAGGAEAKTAAEIAGICAKAEARFQAIYGKKSTDQGLPVVLMYKHTFCPPDLEVEAGATVRWVNVDKRTSHSVWFKAAGKPESERLFPEETVEMSFPGAGEHDYLCGPHWESEGMRGRLKVVK
jgi:plastocyanin